MIKELWQKFIHLLFGHLTDQIVPKVMEHQDQAKIELLKQIDEFSKVLEKKMKELDKGIAGNSETLHKEITNANNRIAQIMALMFGKNSPDTSIPLSREPKEFNFDHRQ
jgi:hypothetical protein